LADPSIKTVIFDINSPGGSTRGALECAGVIAKLTLAKETIAYSSDCCCSAAYWLASQCGEIIAAPSATIGNVGTILACVDDSRQWEIAGLKLELFVSSPLKATGWSGKPFTDADRAYLQERMEQADAWIKEAVQRGRPNIPEGFDLGQWFFGQYAMPVGLVDALSPCIEDVVAAVFAEQSGK